MGYQITVMDVVGYKRLGNSDMDAKLDAKLGEKRATVSSVPGLNKL